MSFENSIHKHVHYASLWKSQGNIIQPRCATPFSNNGPSLCRNRAGHTQFCTELPILVKGRNKLDGLSPFLHNSRCMGVF